MIPFLSRLLLLGARTSPSAETTTPPSIQYPVSKNQHPAHTLPHSSLFPLPSSLTPNSSFLTPNSPHQRRSHRAAFTLFELLAVLTVIGIVLVAIVGSYGSWGTAHALTGAARIVEAGLQQARTLATTQRTYVAFNYGTTNPPNATLSSTTGFQSFFCTNTTDAAISEIDLRNLVQQFNDDTFLPSTEPLSNGSLVTTPATLFQRLSRSIHLRRRLTADGDATTYTPSIIIFRPDGSIMTDDGITRLDTDPSHYIAIETARPFPVPNSSTTAPLLRLIRIDPATGHTTILGGAP